MISRSRAVLVATAVLGTAAASALPVATSQAASSSGGRGVTIVSGLQDPYGLAGAKGRNHRGLVVAEGNGGKVTRVFLDGHKRTILRGVPGVAGVAASPRWVFAVMGGDAKGNRFGASRLVRMTYAGKSQRVIANLKRYELRHNPDGQVQFVNGKPPDALSNPFAMTWSRHGLFVADGGANDVLKVNPRTGRITTFFVPSTVKDVKACLGPMAQANPGTKGCDPVPTGVQVLGNSLWVSTLGAEAPGAGRIYRLDVRTGRVRHVWKNLTAPTGIAVRRDGTVYFSQVLHGAPTSQTPPPNFDPADVGRIARIQNGHKMYAPVTMPTGLVLKGGRLYSSSWSIASFLNIKNAGRVVRVGSGAFR